MLPKLEATPWLGLALACSGQRPNESGNSCVVRPTFGAKSIPIGMATTPFPNHERLGQTQREENCGINRTMRLKYTEIHRFK